MGGTLAFGSKTKPNNHRELFAVEAKNYALPVLANTPLENAYHELELLGFPLSMTLFELLKTEYRGEIYANGLINQIGQVVKMVGLYVCEKTVLTKTNQKMWFGDFLDVEGNTFDTVHSPNRTPHYPFRGKGCYLILGKVVAEFGVPGLEVLKFAKLPIHPNPVLSYPQML
ncbi:hypothetical protein [Mucilaginibacter pedocola]|uniref:Uncharacterized protein n=1 Tax=Mucilaginibacter pedocola TaxID=1792845 RepID=A0A1S9PHH6_9SPHI|nr:hypothetical protein [Mucilaginibacter pedocola]OOQ60410.1 hypothetical protein BC343_25695 [Mucilaginibacter pedocola]